MALAAQGFDPVVEDLSVLNQPTGKAAAEVDLSIVDQAAESEGEGLLVASKGSLPGGHPGDFLFGDHTGGERLQKDFPERHDAM